MTTLHLYRVRITMDVLVCAESEAAAEAVVRKDREVIDDARYHATASADRVRELYQHEHGTLVYGVPDEHPWRDTWAEEIAAEIAARRPTGSLDGMSAGEVDALFAPVVRDTRPCDLCDRAPEGEVCAGCDGAGEVPT